MGHINRISDCIIILWLGEYDVIALEVELDAPHNDLLSVITSLSEEDDVTTTCMVVEARGSATCVLIVGVRRVGLVPRECVGHDVQPDSLRLACLHKPALLCVWYSV